MLIDKHSSLLYQMISDEVFYTIVTMSFCVDETMWKMADKMINNLHSNCVILRILFNFSIFF